MLLTILTLFVGETELTRKHIILIILGVTFFKVQMIVDYFMGLRKVRWGWQVAMFSWSFLIISLIGFAFL
jgi:heme/copper-type cytochrome/quinol oxidase subunit 4